MFNRLPPTKNAYASDRNEEIRYLKWDLQRFLEAGDTRLLTSQLKTQIARLAACLASFRNMPDDSINFQLGLEMLAATSTQVNQTIDELNRNDLSGEHHPTPREKLVRAELMQLIARMAHMASLLRESAQATSNVRSL